jgi:uncharacterized protein YdeI (BOF family)
MSERVFKGTIVKELEGNRYLVRDRSGLAPRIIPSHKLGAVVPPAKADHDRIA